MGREYKDGESVRFSPDGKSSLYGDIQGTDDNGNYIVLVDGFPKPVSVEPRQIINEDNIIGVDNDSVVRYLDETGNEAKGKVEDAYGIRPEGKMVIDGKEVEIKNIIGLANPMQPYAEGQSADILQGNQSGNEGGPSGSTHLICD